MMNNFYTLTDAINNIELTSFGINRCRIVMNVEGTKIIVLPTQESMHALHWQLINKLAKCAKDIAEFGYGGMEIHHADQNLQLTELEWRALFFVMDEWMDYVWWDYFNTNNS